MRASLDALRWCLGLVHRDATNPSKGDLPMMRIFVGLINHQQSLQDLIIRSNKGFSTIHCWGVTFGRCLAWIPITIEIGSSFLMVTLTMRPATAEQVGRDRFGHELPGGFCSIAGGGRFCGWWHCSVLDLGAQAGRRLDATRWALQFQPRPVKNHNSCSWYVNVTVFFWREVHE